MKLAIAFWGTGLYLNFLPQWYDRVEKYFLPGVEKKYFVYTDGDLEDTPDNIVELKIPDYGFPGTFHKTFEELLRLEEITKDYDWLVTIDADLYVQQEIGYEEFFDDSKKYFGVQHPCHFMKMPPHDKHPGSYDRNEKSNAYVDDDLIDMDMYFQGCLWGGKIPYIFDLMREIDNWTKEDISRDTVGEYYEESYLNKWFLQNREEVNTLSSEYAYPELFKQHCDFPNRMMHLAKDNKLLGNNRW